VLVVWSELMLALGRRGLVVQCMWLPGQVSSKLVVFLSWRVGKASQEGRVRC